MTKTTSVDLGDHFTHFVEQQISEGRYGDASDVMRDFAQAHGLSPSSAE